MTALVYLRFYGSIFQQTGKSLLKAWWVALLPIALSFALRLVVLRLFALIPSPQIVGFAVGLLYDAALSSYFYFLANAVEGSPVSLREFPLSFRAYFWPIISVYFVYFIASLLLGAVVRGAEQGGAILIGLELVAFIAFNAAPEVLYQQRSTGRGLATLQTAFKFLQENLLTWGIPNVLIAGGLYFLLGPGLSAFAADTRTMGMQLWELPVLAVFVHVLMVFRGHLFKALAGSSHRQRMFKFRNAA